MRFLLFSGLMVLTLSPSFGATSGSAALVFPAALAVETSASHDLLSTLTLTGDPLLTTTGTTALLDAPLPDLPGLELPPFELPPTDILSPLTSTLALDRSFLQPTSVSLQIDTVTSLEEPLTNHNIELKDLERFEQQMARRIHGTEIVDLNEVVVRAVCRNLDVALSNINHLIADDEFHAQQGIFDLRISGISQITRTQVPSGTQFGTFGFNQDQGEVSDDGGAGEGEDVDDNPGGAFPGGSTFGGGGGGNDTKQFQNSLTVGQLLPTGGLVELLFDNVKVERSGMPDPQATTRAGLRASQPLLRNAGPLVTQSRIVLAGFDTRITAAQFRQQLMEAVATAIQLYYELIFAVSNVEVLRISLTQAEELLRVNRAKFEAGVLPELDVLQAQADVAARQQDLIVALQQVEASSDILRAHLAVIDTPCPLSLRPAQEPEIPEYPIQECVFLDEAVAFRPELEAARLDLEKQGINVQVAHNQTLPQVDLFGSYQPTGAGQTRLGSIEEAARTRTEDWRFGIQFNYPLQNREARFRFHQAEKRVDQAILRMQQIRNAVVLSVRDAIRDVETNRASIKLGRATVEFNRAKVETARQRQDVGLATSFDVLFFQRDLAAARISLLRSVIDYNKAIVEVEQAKGTLLESLGIQVCDTAVLKSPHRPKKALGISD